METQNPKNSVSFVSDAKHMDCRGEKLDFDYGAQGKPAFVRYGGSKYAYVYNLQGDVVALLASNGETVVQYEYDAWGKPVTMTGELADTLGRLNPFRYRGYVFDVETGLYYLRSRYYDPVWGRFVNRDATSCLGINDDFSKFNLFAYCGNNPVARKDDTGYAWLDIFFDVASLADSVIQVVLNPASPVAWAALAADAVSFILPGISGGGRIVRMIASSDDVLDAAKYIDDVVDGSKAIKTRAIDGTRVHASYCPSKRIKKRRRVREGKEFEEVELAEKTRCNRFCE